MGTGRTGRKKIFIYMSTLYDLMKTDLGPKDKQKQTLSR